MAKKNRPRIAGYAFRTVDRHTGEERTVYVRESNLAQMNSWIRSLTIRRPSRDTGNENENREAA